MLQKEKQSKKVLRNVLLAFVLMLVVAVGVKLDAKAAKPLPPNTLDLKKDAIMTPDQLKGLEKIYMNGHKLIVNGDWEPTAIIYTETELEGPTGVPINKQTGVLEVRGNMKVTRDIHIADYDVLRVHGNYTQIAGVLDLSLVGTEAYFYKNLNITKVASFAKNEAKTINPVKIVVGGDFTYSSETSSYIKSAHCFVAGQYNITGFGGLDVTFAKVDEARDRFIDVNDGDWYLEAVRFVYAKRLMVGVSDIEFGAKNPLTRGQMVCILYRMEIEPTVEFKSIFDDVKEDDYYASAVIWATNNKIASGISSTKFAPNQQITREMLITMLYRYAAYQGQNCTVDSNALNGFKDKAQVSNWAEEPMKWAITNGIMNGKSSTKLDPQGNATRAEAAQVILNFYKKYIF